MQSHQTYSSFKNITKFDRFVFWCKYLMITLIVGTAIGLFSYRNMQKSSFQILHDVSEARGTDNYVKINRISSSTQYTSNLESKSQTPPYDANSY